MWNEVKSAVDFLTNIIRNRNVESSQVEAFQQTLHILLCQHYENHWFPEKPNRGSGYRCIRINHKMDPIVSKAGCDSGLTESSLFKFLPNELTLWVDPEEVSYRIGEDGSIGVLYTAEDNPAPLPEVLQSCKDQVRSAVSSARDLQYLAKFVTS